MDVFVEPLTPSPHLYIAGGGHVGMQLARAAAEVGFRIHVVDDREKFANAERFPAADEVAVDSIPIGPSARRSPSRPSSQLSPAATSMICRRCAPPARGALTSA